MKLYTLGEILRLGLLKNHRGEAYKHKGTISRIIAGMKGKRVRTPWGMGYAVSARDIEKHNKKQRSFTRHT